MAKKKQPIVDVVVTNHGSLFLLSARTEDGREWLMHNLSPDAQWLGESVAVEPRYVHDIVQGMQDDGLVVE